VVSLNNFNDRFCTGCRERYECHAWYISENFHFLTGNSTAMEESNARLDQSSIKFNSIDKTPWTLSSL
jgi:hypothetical protein